LLTYSKSSNITRFLKGEKHISIPALIYSERPIVVRAAPQPKGSQTSAASKEQARASCPGRGLRTVPRQPNVAR